MSQSVERMAEYFVTYLFDTYQGTRHVRRVATWIGFLLKSIERASGGTLQRSHTRQLVFGYRDSWYKVRYNHKAGPRGGIEIVETLSEPGSPDGDVVVTVTNLDEAEDCYSTLEERIDAFSATKGALVNAIALNR